MAKLGERENILPVKVCPTSPNFSAAIDQRSPSPPRPPISSVARSNCFVHISTLACFSLRGFKV